MIDSKTWLWSAYFDGMWRTTNGGTSWEPVIAQGTYSTTHGVHASNGKYYTGGVFTLLESTDGVQWDELDGAQALTSLPPIERNCS